MTSARPPRVLIVDDNAVLRILLAQLVECAGYEAIPVDSGEAALELALSDPPDVCVVDQVMPGMSGAELIRKLRGSPDERLRQIPAIGVSALSEADAELLAAGAVAALRKPLTEGPLIEGLRRALPAAAPLADATRPASPDGVGAPEPARGFSGYPRA